MEKKSTCNNKENRKNEIGKLVKDKKYKKGRKKIDMEREIEIQGKNNKEKKMKTTPIQVKKQ